MPQYTDVVKGQTFKHLDTTKLIAIRFATLMIRGCLA